MTTKSPFKFLDSYTSADKDIFFGREKELEELHQKVFESRQLILYGSSGTGKTSLVQCGLATKLEETDWMPVIIRKGENINDSIKNTLQQIAVTPIKKGKTVAQFIQSVYLDFFKPVFLIFDQFEELFIFGNDEEINQFIDHLKECLSSDISCRFIFVLRGEYLENIARFEEAIPEFFENRMRIERMTRSNATRVINESCRAFNIQLSEHFASLLLDRLSPLKSSIELTYLQVYLDKLYKNVEAGSNHSPVFNEELLKESGMIEDVLAEFLDEQVAQTHDPETAITILKAFVSGEGTKKPCTIPEVSDFVKSFGKPLSEEQLKNFIKQFVDLRILKDKDETGRYELRHDALASKIFEQISLSEKEMLEVRQFFLNRYAEFVRRGVLLTEQDNAYLAPYLNKLFLDEQHRSFLERSNRVIARRRNRRRNIAVALVSVILLVLMSFSFIAFKERDKALVQQKIAEEKTKEALHQKESADSARVIALSASQQSLKEKEIANQQSKIADEQKQIAQQQTIEVKKQSQLTEQQKQYAEEQERIAKRSAAEALRQKNIADSARAKANQLRLISIGQNVGFRSFQFRDEPQLSALLACTSFDLLQENGGNLFDPQLYRALSLSYSKLNPDANKALTNFSAPVKSSALTADSGLEVFCADGFIYNITASGKVKDKVQLISSAKGLDDAFFSADGSYILTSYDDFSMRLWDVRNPSNAIFTATQHTGLIRTMAFKSEAWFATAGRDSMVIIWQNKKATLKIHLSSRVRILIPNQDYSVLYAGCEDGNVYSINAGSGQYSAVTSIAGARVQDIYLEGTRLIIGCSDGGLHIFDIGARKIIQEINTGHPIDFVTVNLELDEIIAACNNQTIYIYKLGNILLPPLKVDDIKTNAEKVFIRKDGSMYIVGTNNGYQKRNSNNGWLRNSVNTLLTRNLTEEEWGNLVGKDVPYQKTIKQ